MLFKDKLNYTKYFKNYLKQINIEVQDLNYQVYLTKYAYNCRYINAINNYSGHMLHMQYEDDEGYEFRHIYANLDQLNDLLDCYEKGVSCYNDLYIFRIHFNILKKQKNILFFKYNSFLLKDKLESIEQLIKKDLQLNLTYKEFFIRKYRKIEED